MDKHYLVYEVNSLSIQSNVKLVSFDVYSLFTKVPTADILDYLSDDLQNYELELPSDITVKLGSLCFKDCKFTFNNEYYQQTFGMVMGNPVTTVV